MLWRFALGLTMGLCFAIVLQPHPVWSSAMTAIGSWLTIWVVKREVKR